MVEVVALAGPLAHTGEHGVARVHLGDVVDQFHDQNGLAHAGTAEEADLAALGVGREQVDDLDAGHQDFGFGRLLDELRRGLVDRAGLVGFDRAAFVHRLADHVQDAAQRRVAHGHDDRRRRCRSLPGRARDLRSRPSRCSARCFRPGAGLLREPAFLPLLSVVSAFRISGRWSSNCTSTTAPMTWVTLPFAFAIVVSPVLRALPRPR